MTELAKFCVYNTATGDIVRTGSCPEDMIDEQALGTLESIMETSREANDLMEKVNLQTFELEPK